MPRQLVARRKAKGAWRIVALCVFFIGAALTGRAFSVGRLRVAPQSCLYEFDAGLPRHARSHGALAASGVATSPAGRGVLEADSLVDEINEIASTTEDHHSATAIAAGRAAGVGGKTGSSPRRASSQPVLTLPGDTLEQTPSMVFLTILATAVAVGTVAAAVRAAPLHATTGVAFGVPAAELFSGCFHWATDNYGSIDTPIVGSACAAFQGHHLAPWTISFRSFANNVFKIARAASPFIMLAALTLPPFGAAFIATMLYGQVLAQEFHKWSHMPATRLRPWQRWLQRSGLAVSTAEHCRHHRPPFGAHYCILNGALNSILDSRPVMFWRRLEALVFRLTGVVPNCWKGDKGARVRELALSL